MQLQQLPLNHHLLFKIIQNGLSKRINHTLFRVVHCCDHARGNGSWAVSLLVLLVSLHQLRTQARNLVFEAVDDVRVL